MPSELPLFLAGPLLAITVFTLDLQKGGGVGEEFAHFMQTKEDVNLKLRGMQHLPFKH